MSRSSPIADDLVAGDEEGNLDIFRRDRVAGTTVRVSVGTGGAEADDDSRDAAISARRERGGIHVVRHEPRGRGGRGLRPRRLRARHRRASTTRVSVDSLGVPGNSSSLEPALTPDGQYVVFQSRRRQPRGGRHERAVSDVFLHDRQTGNTALVSLTDADGLANDDSIRPDISADARFVSFESRATDLVVGRHEQHRRRHGARPDGGHDDAGERQHHGRGGQRRVLRAADQRQRPRRRLLVVRDEPRRRSTPTTGPMYSCNGLAGLNSPPVAVNDAYTAIGGGPLICPRRLAACWTTTRTPTATR